MAGPVGPEHTRAGRPAKLSIDLSVRLFAGGKSKRQSQCTHACTHSQIHRGPSSETGKTKLCGRNKQYGDIHTCLCIYISAKYIHVDAQHTCEFLIFNYNISNNALALLFCTLISLSHTHTCTHACAHARTHTHTHTHTQSTHIHRRLHWICV